MKRAAFLASTLLLAACTAVPSPISGPRPVVTGPQIIPAPSSLTITGGAPFELTRATSIVVEGTNPEVAAIGQALVTLLRPSIGYPVALSSAPPDTAASNIYLRLAPERASLGDEGYELVVTTRSATLVANRPAGL